MDWIFEYEESDGSRLSVAPMEGELWFKTVSATGSSTVSVDVVPQAVIELHAALGAWMAENGITARSAITSEPVYGPDSLYGQLIRKAVAEEVARVLPLHQANLPGVCDRRIPLGSPYGSGCGDCKYPWLAHQMPEGMLPESDPEPHDVGHPGGCGQCGRDQDPNGHDCVPPKYEDARPHPVNTDPAPGFLGATVPVGTSHCPDCDHGWNDHTAGYCWGGDCGCPAERPAPVPVTESDKVWGEQGAPPKPVALECICDKHNHRPVVREGSSATCMYRNCGCGYRSAS